VSEPKYPLPPGMSPEEVASIRRANRTAILRDVFHERVLEWLRKHHEGAQFEVTGVTGMVPSGADGYFNSPTFELHLTYTTTDPTRATLHLIVEGSDMESLWRHVVGGDE
jgi:hypothetical protein